MDQWGNTTVSQDIWSVQSDSRKQLCSLVLEVAPKYPTYGVQRLPRNRNERLQTSFLSSPQVFEKGFCVGITTGCDQRRHVKRIFNESHPIPKEKAISICEVIARVRRQPLRPAAKLDKSPHQY
jgi:hypothetical protein